MPRPPLTPAQRSLRSRIAMDDRWSRVPRGERAAQTKAARDAAFARYLRQVDPEGLLPEAERVALARQARRADLRRMALKAARARTAQADRKAAG